MAHCCPSSSFAALRGAVACYVLVGAAKYGWRRMMAKRRKREGKEGRKEGRWVGKKEGRKEGTQLAGESKTRRRREGRKGREKETGA